MNFAIFLPPTIHPDCGEKGTTERTERTEGGRFAPSVGSEASVVSIISTSCRWLVRKKCITRFSKPSA